MAHYVPAELNERRDRLFARATGTVLDVAADGLDFADGSFDTILCNLVLCTVDDLGGTLRRIAALLAPGGQVLAFEHVRGTGWRARLQDASAPVWPHVAARCHANRDVIGAMRQSGLAVTDCDRFMLHRTLPILAPHISVVAVRKAVAS